MNQNTKSGVERRPYTAHSHSIYGYVPRSGWMLQTGMQDLIGPPRSGTVRN